MKYKLLKDIPCFNAGTIYSEHDWRRYTAFAPGDLPEWFEPVPEEPQAVDRNGVPLAVGDLVEWKDTRRIFQIERIIQDGMTWIGGGSCFANDCVRIDPSQLYEFFGLENPLTAKVAELETKLAATQPPSELEVWQPKEGERYWIIGHACNLYAVTYYDNFIDADFLELGNCFKTKEEAQAAADNLRAWWLSRKGDGK